MVADLLNIKAEGHLKIYSVETGEVFYDDHNALVVNAVEVIRRSLGSGNSIDNIIAKKTSSTLATAVISSIIFSPSPGNNEIIYKAIFDQASFDDTLDELNLGSSADGIFSEVTGLSIFKDGNTQLGVEWKLKIFT